MDTAREPPADEAARLRICLNDLLSVTALPDAWTGDGPPDTVATLLDTLLEWLRLAFVFVRLDDHEGGVPGEMVRLAESLDGAVRVEDIRDAIDATLGNAPAVWPAHARVSVGNLDVTVASARLGVNGEVGGLVAGSRRHDFPAQTEKLVLDVAAHQAAMVVLHRTARRNERARRSQDIGPESRMIVDSIPGLVALLSPTGTVEVVNPQLLDYFGQTLEELRQWDGNGTVHPEDLPHVTDVFTRSVTSGTGYEIVQRMRRGDGAYRWIQHRGFPIRDANGKIAQWCVLLIDIDDRKRAEDALRESERQFRLLVDTIPAIVWRGTAEGELDYLNQRAVDYLGHTAQSLGSGRWLDIIHPDDRDATVQRWLQSVTTGASYDDVYRIRRADGQFRWIQSVGEPFRDTDGRITQWYGLIVDIDDQKRAENALRESERESRLLVDSIPGLVVALTPLGEVEFVNRQVLDYFGLTLDELRGWKTGDQAHPEDRPRVIELFSRAIGSGDAFDFEVRARRADGAYRWFQCRGFPLPDTHGHIVRWYTLLIDIDERKRAEESLAASEGNLKLIIDTIPALAWTARTDGSGEFFSQYYLNFIGLSAEEAAGSGWTAAVHPEDLDSLSATWRRLMAAGAAGETEARLRRYDGQFRWFLFRTNPLRDKTGTVVKWYGVNTDIEDRRRAEAELRRAYDSFADAQRLSKTGSFITDLVGDDHNWSEETLRIFEFDPASKVTLEAIRDVIHPEDMPLFEAAFKRAMEGLEVSLAYRIITAGGRVKHLRSVAHVSETVNGRPVFIGALQDVTEAKAAEEALNRAGAELAHVSRVTTLSALTASIAHEVNQPLSGIITNAGTCLRMLDSDPPNVSGARETARRTIRDGNRASEVIARLRALFSKRDFVLEPLDLNEATREVIALSANDLQRNRVILQSELADGLPTIRGDRIQLQQVILNLLRNALDAMVDVRDRPRRLEIRTEREGADRVRLTVRDAGVGLPPHSLDSIFDAFHTTKSGGMGIGLFVSRSIIERHHGRLWAQRNNGDNGATFSFSIPTAQDSTSAVPPLTQTS
jgi:PAS domain S-box-containing protein